LLATTIPVFRCKTLILKYLIKLRVTIKETINAIAAKNQEGGFKLNPPASTDEINSFEAKVGFALPDDFKEFYSFCNGFECNEDIFNFLSLHTIIENTDYGEKWFHFAEYMIYSDLWTLKKTANTYSIVNLGDKEIILTTSLIEFLVHFLMGNVFEGGGLYDWHETMQ
jgi:hypothetical protein